MTTTNDSMLSVSSCRWPAGGDWKPARLIAKNLANFSPISDQLKAPMGGPPAESSGPRWTLVAFGLWRHLSCCCCCCYAPRSRPALLTHRAQANKWRRRPPTHAEILSLSLSFVSFRQGWWNSDICAKWNRRGDTSCCCGCSSAPDWRRRSSPLAPVSRLAWLRLSLGSWLATRTYCTTSTSAVDPSGYLSTEQVRTD